MRFQSVMRLIEAPAGPTGDDRRPGLGCKELDMPNLLPRLLPLLALLGLLTGPSGWLDSPPADRGLTFAVAANGMAIDPDGVPITIAEPTDPDH